MMTLSSTMTTTAAATVHEVLLVVPEGLASVTHEPGEPFLKHVHVLEAELGHTVKEGLAEAFHGDRVVVNIPYDAYVIGEHLEAERRVFLLPVAGELFD